ncbi:hypothetical protein BD626DRAFT_192384 [Schizophyllum amplum]|uniref:Uncharacterized protein n=1 Tax=Schizophyllum amplum TaxID=97359 RepID=A0A550CLX4_9AGAR|nr:hypothetical protein BD626DRAFT_192384 [Auriculariopsis ampla]
MSASVPARGRCTGAVGPIQQSYRVMPALCSFEYCYEQAHRSMRPSTRPADTRPCTGRGHHRGLLCCPLAVPSEDGTARHLSALNQSPHDQHFTLRPIDQSMAEPCPHNEPRLRNRTRRTAHSGSAPASPRPHLRRRPSVCHQQILNKRHRNSGPGTAGRRAYPRHILA